MCAMKCTTVTGNFHLFNNLCTWSPVDGIPNGEITVIDKPVGILVLYNVYLFYTVSCKLNNHTNASDLHMY